MSKNNKGFTLIEAIVSVAILAVLLLGITAVFTVNSRVQQAGNQYNDASFRFGDAVLSGELAEDLEISKTVPVEINISNKSTSLSDSGMTLRMSMKYIKYKEAAGEEHKVGGELFFLE